MSKKTTIVCALITLLAIVLTARLGVSGSGGDQRVDERREPVRTATGERAHAASALDSIRPAEVVSTEALDPAAAAAASSRARSIIDQAVTRGELSWADRSLLLELVPRLNEDDREALTAYFLAAVEHGLLLEASQL